MITAVIVAIIAAVSSVVGSGAFWTYLQRRDRTRAATDRLLRGLAYGKIVDLGYQYIERGWITQDEYEEYRRYLYEPYRMMGGNGITERVMAAVSNLPVRSRAKYAEMIDAAKTRSTTRDTTPSDSALASDAA